MSGIFEPHSKKQQDVLFSDKPITIAATGIQWGKALWCDELVFTKDGYKNARDINLGDISFDINGDETKIIGVFHQGKRQCAKLLFHDNASIVVDLEHQNIIYTDEYWSKDQILTTKQIIEMFTEGMCIFFRTSPSTKFDKRLIGFEIINDLECVCFKVDSFSETFTINHGIVTHNTTIGVMRLKMAMHEYTHPTDNFIVTSPTYKILYQSTIPPFLYWNKGIGTYDKKNECFQISGGGKVWFRTGTDPDSVVGITNVRHILCDEAGLYGLYFFENLQARASFKEAPITIVTSPYSLNWLYRDYIRKHKTGDEYTQQRVHLCQAKSSENPYFPEKEYESKRRTMEPRRFNMMYGGNFDKAQGLVYSCFDASKHWIDPITLPAGTKFIAGIDWGYTHPFVITVRAITPLGIHYQVAEFYRTQMMLTDKIDAAYRMKAIYPIEKFIADSANPDDIASFNQAGLRTIPAQKDIKKNIELHWELINSGRYFVFKGDNFHTIDEYETYHYPEAKDLRPDQSESDSSELPVDKDNHCLIGATMVETEYGQKEIREIQEGDRVLTRSGCQKVIFSALTRVNCEVNVLITVNGHMIIATPDHEIWTSNGFIRMDALKYDDILISIEDISWKKLLGMGKSIADILTGKILRGLTGFISKDHLAVNQLHCTKMYGNFITEVFKRAIIFTILTVILLITRLKTLSVLVVKNIKRSILLNLYRRNELSILRESDRLLWHGIDQKRESNGIKNMPKKTILGKIKSGLKNVLSAEKNFRLEQRLKQNIVEFIVEILQDIKVVSITLKKSVNFAERYLLKTSMLERKLVQDRVLLSWRIGHAKEVYDLTVERDHEFFANNILVSNCMDANVYVTRATFTTSQKPNKIIKSDQSDILPARTASNYDLNYSKMLKNKSRDRVL